jgi:hypothetical protein
MTSTLQPLDSLASLSGLNKLAERIYNDGLIHCVSSSSLRHPNILTHTNTMAEVTIPSNVPEQYKPGWQGSTDKKMAGQMQENVPGLQHDMLDAPLDDVLANGEKYKGSGKLKGKNAVITGEYRRTNFATWGDADPYYGI